MLGGLGCIKMDLSYKVLTNQPNTTYSSSTVVFYYILQHVLAVQISHHKVYNKKCKWREACLYSGMNYNILFQKKWNNKVKTNT